MTENLKAQKLPEADYPRELWFAALNAYREIGLRSGGTTSDRVNAIADAILAERQRIADELFERPGFMVASSDFSGDYVKISFPSMKAMHDFHDAMVRLSQFKSAHPHSPSVEMERSA